METEMRAMEIFALRFLVRSNRLILEAMIADAPPTEDWKERACKVLEYERLMKIDDEL
jgi:hypothetical protein